MDISQKNYSLTLKVKEMITAAFHHYLKMDQYIQTHIKRQKFSLIIFHLFSVTKKNYTTNSGRIYYFRHCSNHYGVKGLLDNLDSHKATGPDNIPTQLLKKLSHELSPTLTMTFSSFSAAISSTN